MRLRLYFAIVAILALACRETRVQESRSSDSFILDSLLNISGERELAEKFGRENILRDTVRWPGSGRRYQVTVLNPASPGEVLFLWNDSINFSSLNAIMVNSKNTRWRTTEGITIGTPLYELVDRNKGPFEFIRPGDQNDGGTVLWKEGALQHRGIHVALALEDEADIAIVRDSVSAGQRISSEWAFARGVHPTVQWIIMEKEHE